MLDRVKSYMRRAREIAETVHDLVGSPLARKASEVAAPTAAPARREAAPVMIYFDGKDHRTKKKIEELLEGRAIPFKVLDVTNDEATRSWAVTQAKLDEFPLVFVAGDPVGGFHELTHADVNGLLIKKVFG